MPEGEGQTPDVLIKSLRTATDRANEASLEFDALMSAIPSGMHPEGVQRIQNASRALSAARARARARGPFIGQTAARHTSQEFVAFLEEVVGTQPVDREVHVILDNFATHKTELDIEIAIVRANFEERIVGTIPLIDDLFDHVVTLAKLKTDRALVLLSTGVAFHPQFHLLPLSSWRAVAQ